MSDTVIAESLISYGLLMELFLLQSVWSLFRFWETI